MAEALAWAWGDELPKEAATHEGAIAALQARSAWSTILRYGETHSVIDRAPNRWGCVPFDASSWPHADAYRIADAVGNLTKCTVDVPGGWHPMPWLAAIDEALARRALDDTMRKATIATDDGLVFRIRPDMLVVRFAILGIVPDWRLDTVPAVEFEMGANGKPRWFVRRTVQTVAENSDRVMTETVEVDGWSARLKRPVAGAYRRSHFEPNPVPAMVARAEYEIFCAAMTMLAAELTGSLETIEITPIDWPVQPWADSPEERARRRRGRILEDISTPTSAKSEPNLQAKSTAKKKGKALAKSR
ncbi:hypothetical protein [Mesorhizobium sp. CAU 1732]|uniref:hypothetical protein n=1 Tax=Mesorhizobium sp. CAU 1732 TaxID=3140358 RepID=UPI003260E92F